MAPHRYSLSSSAAVRSEPAAGAAAAGRYYGEPHKFDPSFRGPVCRRSCTDILCCLIFIIVILSYVALGIVAWSHGDPRKVLYPTDSYGQFCGQKGTSNAKKPILFYFNILKCANPTILINLQCPTTQVLPQHMTKYQFHTVSVNSNMLPSTVTCSSHSFTHDSLSGGVDMNSLPSPVCRGITGLVDTREMGMKIMEDYAKSWTWILIGLLISLAVSLVFILLLRFTAGLLLWTTIISVVLLLAYGMWYCSVVWSQLRHTPGSDVAIAEVGLQTDLQVYLQLRQTWIVFLVSLGVTEASILAMLIFLRRRVRVSIALLREASKAIGHIMSTLFFPVVTFLLLTLCISCWAVTAVYLASSGEAIYKVTSPDVSCPYTNSTCNPETFNRTNISTSALCLGSQCLFAFYGGETSYHRHLPLLQLSNLLVFLWLVNFSLALEQCTLAGTFASYYWAKRKHQDIPACPLFSSFSRAVRYHTGSLAFGALILSVVQLLRIILEFLEQKLKGLDNSLSRFLMCCLKCCFWCLDKFIRYMNHNAYIMVAIYGQNFCTSAREAFFLLMRNVVRVAVLDRVTDFLLFLGKVLIAGGVGVFAFFFFTRKIPVIQEEVPNLNYYWVPLLTVVTGAYLIAHGFFSVYAMCVDTLFLCFCEYKSD
uniref:Choline transporter-like protein n=1 Tax=Scophthalmus maximus TaxID=52904 RepID=A0A8D3C7Z4_SCOMX